MTSHQVDIIITRIEAIEFALAAFTVDSKWGAFSWIDKDGHIKEPRDLVREKALKFNVTYEKLVKRNREQLEALDKEIKVKQERLRNYDA